jgi:phthalate 4,5-dioxygenase oxygenase subunit
MATQDENELLTHIGPETAMGRLMRQYWIPACLSRELTVDGDPMRLLLLGEKLIAFRDSAGTVGILDHRCAHRCASLFYGRNEEGGLRCVYHGWKWAADGTCLEAPSLPTDMPVPSSIKARAYPVTERGGVVWAYMGPLAEPPALPAIEATLLPEAELGVFCHQRACNWLQCLEGDIDTSHFGFLHAGAVKDEELDPANIHSLSITQRAPRYQIADTPWGAMYTAYRTAGADTLYHRIAHFLFPFFTMFPDGNFATNIVAAAWIPMDDTHSMVFYWIAKKREAGIRTLADGTPVPGLERDEAYLPNTTDWYGRWRPAANAGNDYLMDRAVQRSDSFTGMVGVNLQDLAITESMGEIVDRSLEHLGLGDQMIVRTRRRLAQAARALEAEGTEPPGLRDPGCYLGARSGAFAAPAGLDWREAYEQALAGANRIADLDRVRAEATR